MLGKYSFGTGDRFGQEGPAQLRAVIRAQKEHNITVNPVWNKSHREHTIIGTRPSDVRREADDTVERLQWDGEYFVDADHITKEIVDPYIGCSDFFTIDVAEYIGRSPETEDLAAFIEENRDYTGGFTIPGIPEEFAVTEDFLIDWADRYLLAVHQAKDIYEYIRARKERAVFEVSMDEVEKPQSPIELFFILKTLADFDVRIDTVAPKFTGEFYKGVDYIGNVDRFADEFERDILVIACAVGRFDLPKHLKLSVHSGSDKFSLYPHMYALMKKHNTGIHLKTSGTTWLEELIGLVESGPEGGKMVRDIYGEAYPKFDELTAPYASVTDIDRERLPDPEAFQNLDRDEIAGKITHNPQNPRFDSGLRQFLHCSYKIAARKRDRFVTLLKRNSDSIGRRVTGNLYEKHIEPLFLGK